MEQDPGVGVLSPNAWGEHPMGSGLYIGDRDLVEASVGQWRVTHREDQSTATGQDDRSVVPRFPRRRIDSGDPFEISTSFGNPENALGRSEVDVSVVSPGVPHAVDFALGKGDRPGPVQGRHQQSASPTRE